MRCKFGNCKERRGCERKDNPWKDLNLCGTFQRYINSDQVKLKEVAFSYMNFNTNLCLDESAFGDTAKSRSTLIFQMYFLDHKKVKEIALLLNIKPVTVYKQITKVKKNYMK